jgi:hypothetical protein
MKSASYELRKSRREDKISFIYSRHVEITIQHKYLDLHLKIDSARRSITKLYDIRDDFNFSIVNFPFICSNIPATPAYGVYISQFESPTHGILTSLLNGNVDKWNISVVI